MTHNKLSAVIRSALNADREVFKAMMEQRQLDELKELQDESVGNMSETSLLDQSFVDPDFPPCTK